MVEVVRDVRASGTASGTDGGDRLGDGPPLPPFAALAALARCAATTTRLLGRHGLGQPTAHVGEVVGFADGSHGRVYRETVATGAPTDEPVVLVVAFRLRGVRGRGHAVFRAESLLNTPLFAGFPGFVSKLWLAHDEHGRYRGVYQWNGAEAAHAYVRALWWVLALVSHRTSIRYVVLPAQHRDAVLSNPALLDDLSPAEERAWWRPASVQRPQG